MCIRRRVACFQVDCIPNLSLAPWMEKPSLCCVFICLPHRFFCMQLSEEGKCGKYCVSGGKPFQHGSGLCIQYVRLVPGILPRSAQWYCFSIMLSHFRFNLATLLVLCFYHVSPSAFHLCFFLHYFLSSLLDISFVLPKFH